MHGNGSIGTDIHRDVWIPQRDGLERKFSFTNVDAPARQGQRVALLLDGARPVALVRRRHLRLRRCSSLPASVRPPGSSRYY